MNYRSSKAIVTNYQLAYVLHTGVYNAHNVLRIKCYLSEERKSIKFKLPTGDARLKQFLLVVGAKSTDDLQDKVFQILFANNHIYGISKIGDMKEVKYIPATPYDASTTSKYNKMVNLEALESFMAECVHTDRQYFIEME